MSYLLQISSEKSFIKSITSLDIITLTFFKQKITQKIHIDKFLRIAKLIMFMNVNS